MAVKSKAPRRTSGAFILGRRSFGKISEVEGIKPSRELDEEFKEFDRNGVPAAERRRLLSRKYAPKR